MQNPIDFDFRPAYCWHATLDSTNSAALAAADRGAPEGTVIAADLQTAGRGRQGRPWVSPSSVGLYASLLLRPGDGAGAWTLLPLLAGVAAAEAMRAVAGCDAGLKWPNDVLLNRRKIAGILVEAEFQPPASRADPADAATGGVAVIGLGVNVNTPPEALPERPLYPASSLLAETGHRVDRDALLEAWVGRVAAWYGCWKRGEVTTLQQHWSLWNALRGQTIRVTGADGVELQGVGDEVDTQGALRLRTPTGDVIRVVAGDVRCARRRASSAQC